MTLGISEINSQTAIASAQYISTSFNVMTALKESTITKLKSYNIEVTEKMTEEEAQKIIDEKEAEKAQQTQATQNSETYYDKQIITDAKSLAEDIGVFTGEDTDVLTLMENIATRLKELESTVGDNKNLKSIVDEYSNRYDYIYAQYMNKKSTLSSQIVSSMDIMGLNGISSMTTSA